MKRTERIGKLHKIYGELIQVLADRKLTEVDWDRHPTEARQMDRLARELVGLPTVSGSTGRMFSDSGVKLDMWRSCRTVWIVSSPTTHRHSTNLPDQCPPIG